MIEYKRTFRVSQFHMLLHVLNEKLNEFITQRSADLPVHSDVDDNVMLGTFQYKQGWALWKCMEELLFRTIFPADYENQYSPTL